METIETPTGDELIAHITESFHTGGSPFVVAMGLQVVHAETGFVRFTLPVTNQLTHGGGVLSGQAIMSCMDTGMVFVMMSLRPNDDINFDGRVEDRVRASGPRRHTAGHVRGQGDQARPQPRLRRDRPPPSRRQTSRAPRPPTCGSDPEGVRHLLASQVEVTTRSNARRCLTPSGGPAKRIRPRSVTVYRYWQEVGTVGAWVRTGDPTATQAEQPDAGRRHVPAAQSANPTLTVLRARRRRQRRLLVEPRRAWRNTASN
ncbi:MAG: hypothetical protein R2697_00210 [Ilumatobacteraceae bacterium]